MSVVTSAVAEMQRAGFEKEDVTAMKNILEMFFDNWDSGGAVYYMQPVLNKLLAGKPLSALTGDDDEWFDHGNMNLPWDGQITRIHTWQNIRCGSVFKEELSDGTFIVHDIDAADPIANITFPYDIENDRVSSPVVMM